MSTSALPGVVPVPVATTTACVWEPTAGRFTDASLMPHRGRQYDATIPARIGELRLELPPALAAELEDASDALRDFDRETGAEVAGFATLLVRSEALSSSQIEHVESSARQVIAAEIGESSRTAAGLVVASGHAVLTAVVDATPVDATLTQRIHAALMAGQSRYTPGEFRREAVWIGTSSASPIGAEFVAPPSERVPALLDDWSAFSARRDLPPLAQALVGHAQFETIHPFSDGNGRTGRALLQAILRRRGVTREAIVPVSGGLLADTAAYFDALTAFRDGDAAPILRAGIAATEASLANSRTLVAELRDIRDRQRAAIMARSHSRVWEVLDYAVAQPVFTPAHASRALGIASGNLQRHLDVLLAAGVLVRSASEHRGGGKVYRSDDILAALDRFSARATRRIARGA